MQTNQINITITVVMLLLSSCAHPGQILTVHDESRNTTNLSLRQILYADKRPFFISPPYDLEITYTSVALGASTSTSLGTGTSTELVPSGAEGRNVNQITAHIRIGGFNADEGLLKEEALLCIDGENYPITLTDISGGIEHKLTRKSVITGFAYTSITRMARATFVVPEEARKKLASTALTSAGSVHRGTSASCKVFSIRISTESKVLTFVAKGKAMERVREFVAAGERK